MGNTSTKPDHEYGKWVQNITSNWNGIIALATLLCVCLAWRFLFSSKQRRQLPHPPGPRGWPLVGALPLLGNRPHESLRDLAKKYGPLMFMYWGLRPTLIASNSKMAREILKTHDQFTSGRPALEVVSYLFWDLKDFAFANSGYRWKELRKMCNVHIFNHSRVVEYQEVRRRELMRALRLILEDSQEGEPVYVSRYMADMSTNNVTLMMWNKRHCGLPRSAKSSSAAQEDEVFSFQEVTREVLDLISAVNIGDLIPGLKTARLQGYTKRMKAVRNRMNDFLDKIIKEHQQQLELSGSSGAPSRNKNPDALLTVMLRQSQDDESDLKELLTMDTIKAVLMDMIVGATDTSSSTLEWTLAELIKNPSIMKKLQDEITAVVGPDRLVEEADIPKLKYLQAVIHESLRLHLPGPLGGMHMTTEDVEIAGYHVPQKTVIFVNWFAIVMDPDIYDKPEEYRPERFLDSSAVENRTRAFEFNPFSAGRRVCPGDTLALALMHISLANLVHAFTWSLPNGQKPEDMDMSDKLEFVRHMTNKLAAVAKPRLSQTLLRQQLTEDHLS